ncbi:hypothetical protein BV20DRAFT_468909 [Pilatotrama ljubarskyi]|nr:hypothetical protein BV20DRAFT_468909 [Pilatotrama ljubarskyi]
MPPYRHSPRRACIYSLDVVMYHHHKCAALVYHQLITICAPKMPIPLTGIVLSAGIRCVTGGTGTREASAQRTLPASSLLSRADWAVCSVWRQSCISTSESPASSPPPCRKLVYDARDTTLHRGTTASHCQYARERRLAPVCQHALLASCSDSTSTVHSACAPDSDVGTRASSLSVRTAALPAGSAVCGWLRCCGRTRHHHVCADLQVATAAQGRRWMVKPLSRRVQVDLCQKWYQHRLFVHAGAGVGISARGARRASSVLIANRRRRPRDASLSAPSWAAGPRGRRWRGCRLGGHEDTGLGTC